MQQTDLKYKKQKKKKRKKEKSESLADRFRPRSRELSRRNIVSTNERRNIYDELFSPHH